MVEGIGKEAAKEAAEVVGKEAAKEEVIGREAPKEAGDSDREGIGKVEATAGREVAEAAVGRKVEVVVVVPPLSLSKLSLLLLLIRLFGLGLSTSYQNNMQLVNLIRTTD